MPLFSKHSNRSKHALDDNIAGVGSATATTSTTPTSPASTAVSAALGKTDEARATTTTPSSQQQQPDQQQQQQQSFALMQLQQQQLQKRRTSQPYTASPVEAASPTIDYPHPGTLVRPQSTYSSPFPQLVPVADRRSVDDLALTTPRTQLPSQAPNNGSTSGSSSTKPSPTTQSPVVEHKKSKSLFDRMRSSTRAPDPNNPSTPPQGYILSPGTARRLSRRLQSPPVLRTPSTNSTASPDKAQHLDWQASQEPRSYLPSPQEHAEDRAELDPYLAQNLEQPETRTSSQEQSQQPTIRSVPSDLEQEPDDNTQLVVPQSSHQQGQGQDLQLSPYQNALGISHDPYSQNFETVSQLSFDTSADPRDDFQAAELSNNNSPTSNANSLRSEHTNTRTAPATRGPREGSQYIMAPGGTSQQARRTTDPKQAMQGNPAQADANYRQQFGGNSTPTAVPSASPLPTGPGNDYRGGPPQREQFGDRGRSTPPPATERDVNDAYKEILQKYKKVKGLYFDKTAQVEQLQNSLANQRLSQSRTSLDDNEYMTRFQRLDGATTNLAFNIRKNWRSIPNWLAPSVNQDALQIGKQEMTAVGRAFISRFLIEEVFNKTFHPGLDHGFSTHLKVIEHNIRRFAPTLNNQEESDALTAKVVQWRQATLDGLREVLQSPESEEHQKQFTRVATTNLTANLVNFLSEPVPAGIADSAHMIIELAVNIACNLPLESRDIAIMYPLPGDPLQPAFMKAESGVGMPALENPGIDPTAEADGSSTASGDKDEVAGKDGEKQAEVVASSKLRKDRPNKGGSAGGMLQPGTSSKKSSAQNTPDTPGDVSAKSKLSDDGAQKVRFAGFLGVEVRGRQILAKAPVWTLNY